MKRFFLRCCIYIFRTSFHILVQFEDRSVVIVIAVSTFLCLATLESAGLAIDGPKMKNSTMLGLMTSLSKKTMRHTWAN